MQHIRDVTYGENHSQVRTGNSPRVMASLGNLAIGILKLTGTANIAAASRHHGRDAARTLATLDLSPKMTTTGTMPPCRDSACPFH
jgi:hypothetical protein